MKLLLAITVALAAVVPASAQELVNELDLALVDVKEMRIVNGEGNGEGNVRITIEFHVEAAYRFVKFTEANVGKVVTLKVNGHTLWKDIGIREKITGGSISMTTDTLAAALQLLQDLVAPRPKAN